MTTYTINPERSTLHGHFSRDLPPTLTIESGDTVVYSTLEAGWHLTEDSTPTKEPPKFEPRDEKLDNGHALCGPVYIKGAKPGMVLEVRIKDVQTGTWGWSTGGGWKSSFNEKLGVTDAPGYEMFWHLDNAARIATNQYGHKFKMRPFMGVMGMPPDEEGIHQTFPPRFCGGNMDCKELVAGTTLFLPIAVEGGLFSTGDGHALQGDGEVSGVAIECPMSHLELEFHVHETSLPFPRARTETEWLTFGFHEDLNQAWALALDNMLLSMTEFHGLERKAALNIASLVVDLRITQVVNGVCGVHAAMKHGALDGVKV